MARVWPARAGALIRQEAVLTSNIDHAERFSATTGVEQKVTPQASQMSGAQALFFVDGNAAGWPGFAVAPDDPFAIAGDFGLSVQDGGSSIFPFEFDSGAGGQGGSGGGQGDLGPVEINEATLADGDLLTWDEDAGAWVNLPAGMAGPADGYHLVLGDPAVDGDGSFTPGAVPLTPTTPVTEAIDLVNEVLAKLVPSQPPAFPNGALSISNTVGSTPRLASGVTDNSGGGSGYIAGGAVNRITAAGVSTFAFNDVGPGDAGTITALLNGAVVATRALNGLTDNGTYSGLVIADQKDFPIAQPGFWKSIDVSLNLLTSPVGIDKIKLAHSGAGMTGEVFFVRDATTALPAVTVGSVVETTAGSLAYSSGVPHYGAGAVLTVGASISNLAGETYYGGADPLTVTGTNGVISAQVYGYAALGISTPIARQTLSAVAVTPVTVNVDGALHGSGLIQGTAKNVNGASAATSLSTKIVLVKRGAAGAKVDELSVPVTGLGTSPNASNAVRVAQIDGDTPAGVPTAWNAVSALPAHEAAVVAGVLKHDQTNYATGYLPVGPNLSTGRTGAQYVTFSFNRTARSAFKINVTGTYSGCRIKLPGVSDNVSISANAPNGWWNAFLPYDGAGVPGEVGDTLAGCASGAVMNGASGSFTITFGTQSSTNAAGNEILVRFKLAAGQSITALSFSN